MEVPDLNSWNGSLVKIKFDFGRMVQVAHIERGIRRVLLQHIEAPTADWVEAADAATVEVENSNGSRILVNAGRLKHMQHLQSSGAHEVNEEVTEPT